MKSTVLAVLAAALSTLTTALPSPPVTANPQDAPLDPDMTTTTDSRAATIFKATNLSGESLFIPANDYCTDMRNVFGGFDGQVRSLSVEKGMKCDFYQEEGCNLNDFTGGGMVLEVGFRGKRDVRRWLGSWEGRVASVYCQRIA